MWCFFRGLQLLKASGEQRANFHLKAPLPGCGPIRPPGVSAVTRPRGRPAPVAAPPRPGHPTRLPRPVGVGPARGEARARDGRTRGRPRRGECLRGAGARAVSPLLRRGWAGASPSWGRAGGGGRAAPRAMIGTVLCYVLLPAVRLLRALRGNPAPGGRRRGREAAGGARGARPSLRRSPDAAALPPIRRRPRAGSGRGGLGGRPPLLGWRPRRVLPQLRRLGAGKGPRAARSRLLRWRGPFCSLGAARRVCGSVRLGLEVGVLKAGPDPGSEVTDFVLGGSERAASEPLCGSRGDLRRRPAVRPGSP